MVAPTKISVPSSTIRQKGILLRLVEAMHLIEKQHGGRRVPRTLRACSTTARMSLMPAITAESAMNSRVGAVGDQPRERGLAGARRPPQDHRMQLARLERAAQRLAGAEQMRLPDELIEGLRPHPIRERPIGAVARSAVTCASRPITSTPGGGAKVNSRAANVRVALGVSKTISCVIWLSLSARNMDAQFAACRSRCAPAENPCPRAWATS